MTNCLYVLVLTSCLAVLASATISREAYCNIRTCNGPSHTLCQYPFLQPSRRCGVIITAALTGNEVQELLHVHNQYNQIPQIKWDQELAASAQTWADQCVLRADACRNTERAIVAQSWSYTRTAGPIRTPLSELVNLNRVPKGTTIMGCGAIRYNPDGKWNTAYLVCNYARPVY